MNRHPPRSTLFPYPALSRSERQPERLALRPEHDRRAEFAALLEPPVCLSGRAEPTGQADLAECGEALVHRYAFRRRGDREREDRKSTRLNSSHLVISYAVFC